MKRRADKRRAPGRFMSLGMFGGLGAIGERMGMAQPLDGFDPEAFQHGAYGNPGSAAPPEERSEESKEGRD